MPPIYFQKNHIIYHLKLNYAATTEKVEKKVIANN